MDKLIHPTKAEKVYEAKYYKTQKCENLVTEYIGAMTVKQAADYAGEEAYSHYHVISVEELGILKVPKSSL